MKYVDVIKDMTDGATTSVKTCDVWISSHNRSTGWFDVACYRLIYDVETNF